MNKFIMVMLLVLLSASASAQNVQRGYGSGAQGSWTLIVFTDDGQTVTLNDLPSREACIQATLNLARQLPPAQAARLAGRASCFERSRR